MKRQYNKWLFLAAFDNGGILVGYIYNKNSGVPEDVIKLVIRKRGQEDYIINVRIDEAICIAAGLNKVAAQILVGQLPNIEKRGIDG